MGAEPSGQAPPPARDQSTAESRAHASITAQALAATAGLPPTSGQAQRLPIAPLQSEANRRGHFPLTVTGYHGGGCARECLRVPARHEGRGKRSRMEGPASWRRRSCGALHPPCLSHLALGTLFLSFSSSRPGGVKRRVKEMNSRLPATSSDSGLKELTREHSGSQGAARGCHSLGFCIRERSL